MILMPYFLSNSITEAITTEEQSVSGMKPTFNSFFSGASEPAAQAPVRTALGTRLMRLAAAACLRNPRRLPPADPFISISQNKKALGRTHFSVRDEHLCSGRARHCARTHVVRFASAVP